MRVKKQLPWVAAVAVLGALIAACGDVRMAQPEMASTQWTDEAAGVTRARRRLAADVMAEPEGAPQADKQTVGMPGMGSELATLAASQPDRYLIKNATVMIEAEDPIEASELLVAGLIELGGYVADLRETANALGHRSVRLQIRVPSDRFDEAMQRLEPLGKTLNRQVTTEDVSEEFLDTDARVRNLKKTEERILDHLNRTGELDEILKIESELTRVREQIERLEGRLRYLGHRVAFSTIAVTIQQAAKGEPLVPPEKFSTAKVVSEAVRSLVTFLQRIWVRLIWVGIWAVIWAPLGVLALLVLRKAARTLTKKTR